MWEGSRQGLEWGTELKFSSRNEGEFEIHETGLPRFGLPKQ